jgi:hypothetical protein
MNKDIKNIFSSYKSILENTDISNNMSGSDVSTKYTTDNTARFLPIGQDDEEKKVSKPEAIFNKLSNLFAKLKSLISTVESKTCSSKEVSNLIAYMNDAEVKGDLDQLLRELQLQEQNAGLNSRVSS